MKTVRERAIEGVFAALQDIHGIEGLEVHRNEDHAISQLPALVLWDADSAQRVEERGSGVNVYTLDLLIEGFVSTEAPQGIGPAISELYGAVVTAMQQAADDTAEIFEVLESQMAAEMISIDEEDIGPHALLSFTFDVKFDAVPGDPHSTT